MSEFKQQEKLKKVKIKDLIYSNDVIIICDVVIDSVLEDHIEEPSTLISWASTCKTCIIKTMRQVDVYLLENGISKSGANQVEILNYIGKVLSSKEKIYLDKYKNRVIHSVERHDQNLSSKEKIGHLIVSLKKDEEVNFSISRSFDLLNRIQTQNYEPGSNYQKTIEELNKLLKS